MKAAAAFASLIAPDIERYLKLKQSLGREYDGVRRVLANVDLFVSTRGGDLTSDTFAGWCLTLQHLASGTRRSRFVPRSPSVVPVPPRLAALYEQLRDRAALR